METTNFNYEEELRKELQERYMAQTSLLKDSEIKFLSLGDDHDRVGGQGY